MRIVRFTFLSALLQSATGSARGSAERPRWSAASSGGTISVVTTTTMIIVENSASGIKPSRCPTLATIRLTSPRGPNPRVTWSKVEEKK